MRFSYFLTSGLFALSTQAVAIQQETTQDIEKRATVDLAAGVAADILHLIGLTIGVDANINVKRDSLSKRADIDVAADLAADVLGLLGLDVGVDADISVKRDDNQVVSLKKRALVDVAAGLTLDILQLIGLSVGVDASVSKRDTIDASAVVDVLNLIQAQLNATAKVDIKKRGLDVNKLIQDLPIIVSGVLSAVDSIANGTLAALL